MALPRHLDDVDSDVIVITSSLWKVLQEKRKKTKEGSEDAHYIWLGGARKRGSGGVLDGSWECAKDFQKDPQEDPTATA